MADRSRRLPANAPGDLFVDDRCIACDTCRQLAPDTFGGGEDDLSFVSLQPAAPAARHRALLALVSCPVAAIGSESKAGVAEAAAALPIEQAPGVLRCGYAAESSFGAAAWLVLRREGNVMVDSPRFAGPLARRIRALGGIRFLFLTHRDDVADHARWREAFGCERILHARDVTRATRGVERGSRATLEFEWVLPGHGRPWRAASPAGARRAVLELAEEMRAGGGEPIRVP